MSRLGFIGRRLLQMIPLLLGISFLTFLLIKVTPGDPARLLGGPRATPARLAEIRRELGLDQSVFVQYWKFLSRLVQGDLGTSNKSTTSVLDIISSRYLVTAWLVGMSTVLALLASVPLAALAAARRERFSDHAVRGVTVVGLGMPVFWVGIMLIILVALPTGLFPVGGDFGSNSWDHARAVFLPSLAIAISMSPLLIRSLRTSMIGVFESPYVSAARSVGVHSTRLLARHVARNSLAPMISLLAVQVGYLFFAAVVVENTFSLPGLGQEMIFAAGGRDFPVVMGITLVFAIAVVLVHLLADIAIVFIDPRVQIS